MENCSIISRSALHLVGMSYSGPFSTIGDEAIRLQTEFLARKHELNGAEKSSVLYCPYYGNEVFATYWACVEVGRHLEEVPEGMVQFTIPSHQYAMVAVSDKRIGEGYEKLITWIDELELEKDERAVSLELFYFDESLLEEEPVELWIPLRTGNSDTAS